MIGSLQALKAIKLLCGIGLEPGGRLLDFDAAAARWREVRFPIDPTCPAFGGGQIGRQR
jgi:adenylyltransferase/sulfurtransferase